MYPQREGGDQQNWSTDAQTRWDPAQKKTRNHQREELGRKSYNKQKSQKENYAHDIGINCTASRDEGRPLLVAGQRRSPILSYFTTRTCDSIN